MGVRFVFCFCLVLEIQLQRDSKLSPRLLEGMRYAGVVMETVELVAGTPSDPSHGWDESCSQVPLSLRNLCANF